MRFNRLLPSVLNIQTKGIFFREQGWDVKSAVIAARRSNLHEGSAVVLYSTFPICGRCWLLSGKITMRERDTLTRTRPRSKRRGLYTPGGDTIFDPEESIGFLPHKNRTTMGEYPGRQWLRKRFRSRMKGPSTTSRISHIKSHRNKIRKTTFVTRDGFCTIFESFLVTLAFESYI